MAAARHVAVQKDDIGMCNGTSLAFGELTRLGICTAGAIVVGALPRLHEPGRGEDGSELARNASAA